MTAPEDTASAPGTGTGERLAAIWSDVLDIDQVPRSADFFTMGGDSLTATIVTGIVQSEFRVAVTPTEADQP